VKNKLIRVSLIGKTNVGKSTLINSLIGETISIVNRKINTTEEMIIGISNIEDTQIIFYDTPGSSFLNNQNIIKTKIKTNLWEAIYNSDCIFYLIDSLKYNFKNICEDLEKINELKKTIIIIFNKMDLINNRTILPYVNELNNLGFINSFFNISAKYKKGLDELFNFLKYRAVKNKWLYNNNEISNKDDVFISNECTRNAILKFLHKEVPYNLKVRNIVFKILKNRNLKIKQLIELKNLRYKPIILGKDGKTIRKIRMNSQNEIAKIMQSKVHLYLQVVKFNDK